jgi:hypothetical protein
MTQLDALSQVRSTIAESVAGYWTDAELDTYINEGLHAMCESKGIEDVQRLVLDADLRCGLPALAKFVESVYFYPIEGVFSFVATAPATPAEGDQYIDSTTIVRSGERLDAANMSGSLCYALAGSSEVTSFAGTTTLGASEDWAGAGGLFNPAAAAGAKPNFIPFFWA